ncbi:MAG: hypothetical protein CVV27_10755 [Candidatus Melainabacteria bacterium HGW-Melainabacteria-1]|nr:MAG: hypothetical protein CVV27_10755 [Candidatus Melainabacteria bacterium HGW-Melainabacteria-1]
MDRLAPGLNAFTCSFDPTLLGPIQASYLRELAPYFARHRSLLNGGRVYRQPAGRQYYLFSYDADPLFWLSSDTAESFALYRAFFDALGLDSDLKQLLDFQRQIVMYAGFLVIGDRSLKPIWHYDYLPQAHAYTLITPLFELDPDHGHLLYEQGEQEALYHYRPGEAIVFGEGFLHATEPYAPTETIRVLLSLTFGTDNLDHWPILSQAVKAQSRYYVLPCGHVAGRCLCRIRHRLSTAGASQKNRRNS